MTIGGVAAVLLLSALWSAFTIWQVAQDLREARDAGRALGAAGSSDDRTALESEAARLAASAGEAADASDGWWWTLMSHVPVVGDDLGAVRSLSASLDDAASGAVLPMVERLADVDAVARNGALDTRLMAALRPYATSASESLARASDEVADLRPDSYLGPIRDAADEWVRIVTDAATAADEAAEVLEVLPQMVGSDGVQRILLVIETNAEIRATGGLPGSWSLIEADRGRLRVTRQGSGGGIDSAAPGPLETTSAEQAIWGPQLGLYFRDANMTSDFPRAAGLMRERWSRYGGAPLDGIVSVDVVTLGYLLEGLGPIVVAGTILDTYNTVPNLLNGVYEKVPRDQQDEVFAEVARAVVTQLTTGRPASLIDLFAGVARGTVEDRIHVAWFGDRIADGLQGTRLEGRLVTEASDSPLVDITLNDATGSKMSYFLRYDVDVEATACVQGRQELRGSVRLWQTVSAEQAATFDPYVTGDGLYGVPPGNQVVLARIFGPVGGTIDGLTVRGRALDPALVPTVKFRGRPVVTLALQPDAGRGSEVQWTMTTGEGQPGRPILEVTPGVVEGTQSGVLASAC